MLTGFGGAPFWGLFKKGAPWWDPGPFFHGSLWGRSRLRRPFLGSRGPEDPGLFGIRKGVVPGWARDARSSRDSRDSGGLMRGSGKFPRAQKRRAGNRPSLWDNIPEAGKLFQTLRVRGRFRPKSRNPGTGWDISFNIGVRRVILRGRLLAAGVFMIFIINDKSFNPP